MAFRTLSGAVVMFPVLLLTTTLAATHSPLAVRLCPPPVDMVRARQTEPLTDLPRKIEFPPVSSLIDFDAEIAKMEQLIALLKADPELEKYEEGRQGLKNLQHTLETLQRMKEKYKLS